MNYTSASTMRKNCVPMFSNFDVAMRALHNAIRCKHKIFCNELTELAMA